MSNNSKSAKSASSPRVGIFIASTAKGSVPSSGGGGIEEAPIDGTPYVRQDAGWVPERGEPIIALPGEPGSAVMGQMYVTGSLAPGAPFLQLGDTYPGSAIHSACLLRDITEVTEFVEIIADFEIALSGTWACGGYVVGGNSATSWTRIDGTSAMSMTRSALSITDCRYSSPDNSTIDCLITANGKSFPFTASPNDSTEHGPAIYANAVAGDYGSIAVYE